MFGLEAATEGDDGRMFNEEEYVTGDLARDSALRQVALERESLPIRHPPESDHCKLTAHPRATRLAPRAATTAPAANKAA